MFGKPAFNYNYMTTNYTNGTTPSTSAGLNATSTCAAAASSLHGTFVQDFNDFNSMYTQISSDQAKTHLQRTSLPPNSTSNSSPPTNTTDIENIQMIRSLGLPFTHFNANYLNAAASLAAAAHQQQHQNALNNFQTSSPTQTSSSYGLHSSQSYNTIDYLQQQQQQQQHKQLQNESKMSTPTSSSISSASSPTYLSESIESSTNTSNKMNRNQSNWSSNYSTNTANLHIKNENNWPVEKKGNLRIES